MGIRNTQGKEKRVILICCFLLMKFDVIVELTLLQFHFALALGISSRNPEEGII
jgi:hypothetical protein